MDWNIDIVVNDRFAENRNPAGYDRNWPTAPIQHLRTAYEPGPPPTLGIDQEPVPPPLGSLEGAGAGRIERSSRLACAGSEICAPLILYQVSQSISTIA
jgi:hypothetical protein